MKYRVILMLFVISFFVIGCNENNTMPENKANDNIVIEQSSNKENTTLSNQEIASHLATVASEVPSVNDAAALIAGPYAVVGIDIDETTESGRVGTIKFSVSEALQHDPYGKTAVVVADADMMQRIRDMSNKVQQGHPVQGVVDELAEIVSRYMPTFPVDENRPQDIDDNKEKLTDEEQMKLDNKEQKQSNDQKDTQ